MRYILIITLLFKVAFAQSLFGVVASDGFDQDAKKFIIATGITDATQKNAINYLCKNLKANGLWSKMKAIYPAVGATERAHSYNLKDTSLYKLTFPNGATHTSNGIEWNGTNQYANTGLNIATDLIQNNIHISYYSKTNSDGIRCDIGASNSANTAIVSIYSRLSNNAIGDAGGDFSLSRMTGTSTDSKSFIISTRTSSINANLYRNGTSIGSTTNTSSTLPNFLLYIGAINVNNSAIQYTNRTCAFASAGDGLTNTDASNLNTIVTQFQTILGRQN